MAVLHNERWETVCQEYVLNGLTQTEAYLRGFPHNRSKPCATNAVRACELFRRKRVKTRIAELVEVKTKAIEKKFGVDAAYVLRRLVEVDQMDICDILTDEGYVRPPMEWPAIWRQFISAFDVEEIFAGRGDERVCEGLLKKIKWPDKMRALEMLGKHVDVNAFKEVQEVHGPGGGPIRLISTDMTPQQAAEAYADTLNDR